MYKKLFFNLLALVAGLALPLAFAPFSYYLIAVASLLALLVTWNGVSPRKAFWRGWLFGIGFFTAGVYWVYISVHDYGNAPAPLAALSEALLVAFLSLYPATVGYSLNKFFPINNRRKFLLAFPALWVISEWLRGWVLTGFPWLFLGYSQLNTPLSGIAPIFSVYGVSFALCFTSGLLAILVVYRKKIWWWFTAILLLLILWLGSYGLGKISWVQTEGDAIKVSLVQGNIAQEAKWDPEQLNSILHTYTKLTSEHWDSAIIVWPENAVPAFPQDVSNFLYGFGQIAKQHGATIITGIPFYDAKHQSYFNGILAFGNHHGKYFKRHLVPFGEYLPFQALLNWLHKFFTIPMSGFSNGHHHQRPLFVANSLLAPFICYEIAYPRLVLDYLPHAGLLLTICDDSWFDRSIAAAQHLEIAQFRSLEVGRYQLLGTNTGMTAIIDDHGKITTQAPIFQPWVITASVYAMNGATPWVAYGQHLWLLLLVFCLIVARKNRKML